MDSTGELHVRTTVVYIRSPLKLLYAEDENMLK